MPISIFPTFRLNSLLTIATLAVVSLGIIATFVGLVDGMATEQTTTSIALHRGVVAGASVGASTGDIKLRIDDGLNPRTYIYSMDEALSVYNLLRIAETESAVRTVYGEDAGAAQVVSIDGVAPRLRQTWRVLVEGSPATLATVVSPGETVTLRLR